METDESHSDMGGSFCAIPGLSSLRSHELPRVFRAGTPPERDVVLPAAMPPPVPAAKRTVDLQGKYV